MRAQPTGITVTDDGDERVCPAAAASGDSPCDTLDPRRLQPGGGGATTSAQPTGYTFTDDAHERVAGCSLPGSLGNLITSAATGVDRAPGALVHCPLQTAGGGPSRGTAGRS